MKKGFSLIALAVIVIIILILATSITIAANSTLNNSKKLAFANEIKMVQDSVLAYKSKNDGKLPVSEIVILDLSNISQKSKSQFYLNDEIIENEKITLYKIDYDKAKITSLKYGTGLQGHNDIYAVSEKTGKVYYTKGLKIGNQTYYTITEELANILSMGWGNSESSNISYEPTTTTWTKEPVGMKIKILKGYIIEEIVASNSAKIIKDENLSLTDKDYDIYVMENVSTATNYTVTVRYKEAENKMTQQSLFEVANVDLKAPTVSVNIIPEDVTTNSIKMTVEATDNESGIAKYYYSKDGVNFTQSSENTFTFDNLTEDTSYDIFVKVEDNVGNVTEYKIPDSVTTKSLGNITISGDFNNFRAGTSVLVSINYQNIPKDAYKYYKIDSGDWIQVENETSESLRIDKDCTIYAKIVDKSGQSKEIKREILKIE